MNPVSQTKFGGPLDPEDQQGECFAACVASILEMPLDSVPNPNGEDWYEQWQAWLVPRNLRLVTILYEGPSTEPESDWARGLAILSADSRTLKTADGKPAMHALVWRDGEIVWDPSPVSRAKGPYLRRDDGEPISWRTLTIFQALDPAARGSDAR